jgi:hypothetical protein
MNYDKYRAIEKDYDITYERSEIEALKAAKARLRDEIDAIDEKLDDCDIAIRKARNIASANAYEQFKIDALKEAGLTDHPKADHLFGLAWDRGHSGGYHEVMHELDNLAELVN